MAELGVGARGLRWAVERPSAAGAQASKHSTAPSAMRPC